MALCVCVRVQVRQEMGCKEYNFILVVKNNKAACGMSSYFFFGEYCYFIYLKFETFLCVCRQALPIHRRNIKAAFSEMPVGK